MNGVIEREPAISCVNTAEEVMSQVAVKISDIQTEIANLSRDLLGQEGSPIINAEKDFYDKLSAITNNIARTFPDMHQTLANLINSSGTTVGDQVPFQPASYKLNSTAGEYAIYKSSKIGIKNLANAMGYCQSMNNRCSELINIFEEAIMAYQQLHGLADEFPAVQESAHSAATEVRSQASAIATAAGNFAATVGEYLNVTAKTTEENKAEVDSQVANIKHLTSSMSDMMLSLPNA